MRGSTCAILGHVLGTLSSACLLETPSANGQHLKVSDSYMMQDLLTSPSLFMIFLFVFSLSRVTSVCSPLLVIMKLRKGSLIWKC